MSKWKGDLSPFHYLTLINKSHVNGGINKKKE
jgi:hypothetical protein